jgi:NADH:ubiquinone oxidoreductase subunit B-like Fe-S oxidoreductase
MPEPKFVVVVGQCGSSGGIYKGSYNTEGGIDTVIPVNAYIPGCPPRPDAIADGLIKLLASIDKGGKS